jgi:hypothetical protein
MRWKCLLVLPDPFFPIQKANILFDVAGEAAELDAKVCPAAILSLKSSLLLHLRTKLLMLLF